jgi:hypothetical protein
VSTEARVELTGADPSGLAELIAGLLEHHLAREPARARHLHPSTVVLVVPDADVSVTVRVTPGAIRVADGAAPGAHLRIVARSDRLLALAAAPLIVGVPDPRRRDGRAAIADVAAGRVRVGGLFRHPLRLARFTSLLSVSEGGRTRS